ncbi:hypothetical protein GF323_03935 [Candidatus Woesearchaeota archaeon]|nr:hypothetical protein [Candidatus Woesearchaeota archaeon]
MKAKKLGQKIFSIITIISLFALTLAIVYAENKVEPSKMTTWNYISNETNLYPNATRRNYTRGFIHTVNIEEQAPTLKWLAFVGNITGSFALQDSDGYSVYEWDVATTRGEIYATKEGSLPAGQTGPDDGGTGVNDDYPDQGGIPLWESMECANAGNISAEEVWFNHTIASGARANEDSYSSTFTTSFSLQSNFYVGESVEISTGDTCYGMNLKRNDTETANYWEELVLMDGTYETEANDVLQWDLTYVSLIENNTAGYRNGTTYDFQILLPQSGLEGDQPNVAYYFYIELI